MSTQEEIKDLTTQELIISASEQVMFYYSSVDGGFIKTQIEKQGEKINVFYSIESTEFKNWFRLFCFDTYGKIINSGNSIQAQEHFRMVAKKIGKEVTLHRRCIEKSDKIYYDLYWDNSSIIRITGVDVKIIKPSKPMFKTGASMSPQVRPDLSATPQDLVELVNKHFHLHDEADKVLFPLFLVSCLWGDKLSHPLIQLYGPPASAKSTTLKRIEDLIDPHIYDLYDMPENPEDVALALSLNYLCCFDNVSYIPPKISDLLCRNCTGGTQIKRKRFTDTDQSALKLKSVVCLNGVSQNITRTDLAERTLFFEMEKIPNDEKQPDSVLLATWKKDLPLFFGALCNLAKEVLNSTYQCKYASPIRLTDFYQIAVKAGIIIGYSEKVVNKAFKNNTARVKRELAGSSIIVSVIVEFMADKQQYPTDNDTCSVTELFRELKLFAIDECEIEGRYFPGSPTWFSRKLNQNRETLEAVGIYYHIKKSNDGNYQSISLWQK
ncbi:hypothetical protein [Clostridium transplantifaecale]|uniref:hypothetical protein n=1 Tax=Clostridium transplantifaecale TaxID=2479838 RepID=UPI000F644A72|nr:hypothetical protein [Clostridium transplantifaecale]